MRVSQQTIITGEERSGKTYLLERLANAYNKKGKSVFVYNTGMPSDYSSYEWIEFIGFSDNKRIVRKKGLNSNHNQIMLFKFRGKVYKIKDISSVIVGKKVKTYRLPENEESSLFYKLNYYLKNSFVIIDDSKPVFRNGVKSGFETFFNSKNHSGKKSKAKGATGVDVALVFHSIDDVSNKIITYCDFLICFNQVTMPKFYNWKGNTALVSKLKSIYTALKSSPRYTAFQIGLKGEQYLKTVNVTIKE